MAADGRRKRLLGTMMALGILAVVCFAGFGVRVAVISSISVVLAIATVLIAVVMIVGIIAGSILWVRVRRKRTLQAIASTAPGAPVLTAVWSPLRNPWPFRPDARMRRALNRRGAGLQLVIDDRGLSIWNQVGNGHPLGTIPWTQIRRLHVRTDPPLIGAKPMRDLVISIDPADTPFIPDVVFVAPAEQEVAELSRAAGSRGIVLTTESHSYGS